jgi:hypothetical protein
MDHGFEPVGSEPRGLVFSSTPDISVSRTRIGLESWPKNVRMIHTSTPNAVCFCTVDGKKSRSPESLARSKQAGTLERTESKVDMMF